MDHCDQRFLIIGGGIAGVSCAQTLQAISSNENMKICLLSSSSFVKSVTNLSHLTQNITEFDVSETNLQDFTNSFPGIETRCCNVVEILPEKNIVITDEGDEIQYTKLCVCTGAKPSLIDKHCPYVIGIRDTQTVAELESMLSRSKKVVIVGNGGIAMELVYSLKNIEVVWVIKDSSIGKTYFDCGAAEFLLSEFWQKNVPSAETSKADPRRLKYTVFNLGNNSTSVSAVSDGSALGPDWQEKANLTGNSTSKIDIKYDCKVEEILYDESVASINCDGEWPVGVKLSNGDIIGCDFLVSATGVKPNIDLFKGKACVASEESGVDIDSNMRVIGMNDVYAAGDLCNCTWEKSAHWHPMRLWTQARQMGIFAAQCMVSHQETKQDPVLDFCFEIFTHVTQFFGHKVVLLGKFNGQDLDPSKTQLIVRVTPGKEYVKVVLHEGRMYGAVLVGETDLEETFENLILNGMDLSHYGENLLHPNVELDDYFD